MQELEFTMAKCDELVQKELSWSLTHQEELELQSMRPSDLYLEISALYLRQKWLGYFRGERAFAVYRLEEDHNRLIPDDLDNHLATAQGWLRRGVILPLNQITNQNLDLSLVEKLGDTPLVDYFDVTANLTAENISIAITYWNIPVEPDDPFFIFRQPPQIRGWHIYLLTDLTEETPLVRAKMVTNTGGKACFKKRSLPEVDNLWVWLEKPFKRVAFTPIIPNLGVLEPSPLPTEVENNR
jgi:hypothetical protein